MTPHVCPCVHYRCGKLLRKHSHPQPISRPPGSVCEHLLRDVAVESKLGRAGSEAEPSTCIVGIYPNRSFSYYGLMFAKSCVSMQLVACRDKNSSEGDAVMLPGGAGSFFSHYTSLLKHLSPERGVELFSADSRGNWIRAHKLTLLQYSAM
ncbi:hypothetical protein GOODEAATRI_008444 [Goodea atripinnis]|uniref:Uncharacterized protein n=1 Tax=Goodea atripinnis TaxID=208336 RepID=A0ABV0MZQ8_9TELE